eukprot:GDKJ01027992.1.p1 GENE.GDKJ01027992.1~~GDKJ01027992.1.p1  ORF type:complete len:167 (-),score=16.56 GDKJ01027992.1:165-665(-)
MTSLTMPVFYHGVLPKPSNQRELQTYSGNMLLEAILYDEETMTMKNSYSLRFVRDNDGVWCSFVKENTRSSGFMDMFRWGDSEFLVTDVKIEKIRVLNGYSGLVEDKLAMRVIVPGRTENKSPVFILEDDVRDTVVPLTAVLDSSRQTNPDYDFQRRSRRGPRSCC